MSLRDEIAAVTARVGPCVVDEELPSVSELTDDELHVLLDIIYVEGLRRGFGKYWWD